MSHTHNLARVTSFLAAIGIRVQSGAISTPTPYAGVLIDRGSLTIDEAALTNVGNVLHEAAHIAVAPVMRRSTDFAWIVVDEREEIATVAWCWAAVCELRISPRELFLSDALRHAGGAD